mmetsp:Transcript_17819/g.28849  ORF Transcript_17819/g.28849 Transcript_17819/m.28849 type:complete len:290 (-) Transcript_17819:754-1623(-)
MMNLAWRGVGSHMLGRMAPHGLAGVRVNVPVRRMPRCDLPGAVLRGFCGGNGPLRVGKKGVGKAWVAPRGTRLFSSSPEKEDFSSTTSMYVFGIFFGLLVCAGSIKALGYDENLRQYLGVSPVDMKRNALQLEMGKKRLEMDKAAGKELSTGEISSAGVQMFVAVVAGCLVGIGGGMFFSKRLRGSKYAAHGAVKAALTELEHRGFVLQRGKIDQVYGNFGRNGAMFRFQIVADNVPVKVSAQATRKVILSKQEEKQVVSRDSGLDESEESWKCTHLEMKDKDTGYKIA